MNERIWEEEIMACLIYPDIFPEGVRKIPKTAVRTADIRAEGSNSGPPLQALCPDVSCE
jgi:hypothetical protein